MLVFPGCSARDMIMKDHIKAILLKNRDKFIVHVGTNSLKDAEAPAECAAKFVDLAKSISSSTQNTTIVLYNISQYNISVR